MCNMCAYTCMLFLVCDYHDQITSMHIAIANVSTFTPIHTYSGSCCVCYKCVQSQGIHIIYTYTIK